MGAAHKRPGERGANAWRTSPRRGGGEKGNKDGGVLL